jgi:hypothetical protein
MGAAGASPAGAAGPSHVFGTRVAGPATAAILNTGQAGAKFATIANAMVYSAAAGTPSCTLDLDGVTVDSQTTQTKNDSFAQLVLQGTATSTGVGTFTLTCTGGTFTQLHIQALQVAWPS